METPPFSRRRFIKGSAITAAMFSAPAAVAIQSENSGSVFNPGNFAAYSGTTPAIITDRWKLDLTPARWIWFPAGRTLPNSFFHFRKTLTVSGKIKKATGWVLGESRYLLFCNGTRIQFGPAPSDPRYSEADPVDLTSHLQEGENCLGATVLYYGFGDGTWPMGKPGFIFRLIIEYEDGHSEPIISDHTWQVQIARSWKPGQYKRWYLRSLQEDFDAVPYPDGWNTHDFSPDNSWVSAAELSGYAWQTALSAGAPDYLYDSGPEGETQLRRRTIPMLTETMVKAARFVETHSLHWKQDPFYYFDLNIPDAYEPATINPLKNQTPDKVVVSLNGDSSGVVITWEMQDQIVGWPGITVEAPENTIIELMVQEGHTPFPDGGPALMNNHFNSWTRFRCKQGLNQFSTFDFESVKWIQLHIHGSEGNVSVETPRVLRRSYQFPFLPEIKTNEPVLQRLFEASINTILNNSQETIVDGMGRERQQYSGDIGHLIHSLHHAFGEEKLPARFLNTFSQGITREGYFLDCWPAYDRLNRLAQRQLELTPWGPLLDHGIGFIFDSYYHYLYSGETAGMEEVFPRLVRFTEYLRSMVSPDGLMPVEDTGIPKVWIDHNAYRHQRHKHCAFNLYAAHMFKDAFAPLCDVFGKPGLKQASLEISELLWRSVRKKYFNSADGILIVNLPWLSEEKSPRTCDRSLSHLILGNFISEAEKTVALRELETKPPRMGLSYPPNAQWRLWALANGGRIQPVLNELREIWATMDSVIKNNTMSEDWHVQPDSNSQWSHAACAPLYVAYMNLAGIVPLAPGSKKVRIWPQPGDLKELTLKYHTPLGNIHLSWSGTMGNRILSVDIPSGMFAELWLSPSEVPDLSGLGNVPGKNLKTWKLNPGRNTLSLLHT